MKRIKFHLLVFALLSTVGTSKLQENLESAMPYLQAAAFTTTVVSNGLHIVKSFKKLNDSRD